MRLKLPNAKVLRLLILGAPLVGLWVLHLATGFGLRDVQALGRYLHHRRDAAVTISPGPESLASLTDFLPLGGDSLLVVREGGAVRRREGEHSRLGGFSRSVAPVPGRSRRAPLGRRHLPPCHGPEWGTGAATCPQRWRCRMGSAGWPRPSGHWCRGRRSRHRGGARLPAHRCRPL